MDNTRNNNVISDKAIISNVAKAVNRSISMLAEDIDIKKGTLYQITAGINNISPRVKAQILEAYPNVSADYIETGEEPIILVTPAEHDDTFKEEVHMQLAKLDKKIDSLNNKVGMLIIALSKKT